MTIKITITINGSGSAFDGDPTKEVNKILTAARRQILDSLEDPNTASIDRALVDTNGNKVGYASYVRDYYEEEPK
jgi:hypothetical protein